MRRKEKKTRLRVETTEFVDLKSDKEVFIIVGWRNDTSAYTRLILSKRFIAS